jgi:hypothetical protein
LPVVAVATDGAHWRVWVVKPGGELELEYGPYPTEADAKAVAHRLRVQFDREVLR